MFTACAGYSPVESYYIKAQVIIEIAGIYFKCIVSHNQQM